MLSHFSASLAFYQSARVAFEELAPSMESLRSALHARRGLLAEAIESIPRKRQLLVQRFSGLDAGPSRGLPAAAAAAESGWSRVAEEVRPYASRKEGLLLVCTSEDAMGGVVRPHALICCCVM